MGGLTPGAVEHWVWAAEVVAAFVVGLLAIAGGLVAGFRWLRGEIKDSFETFTSGPSFRRVVSGIISDATAGWNDIQNRLHEEHRRAIEELRKRDEERVGTIKALHGRVDKLWDRVGR
jgi:hypothetical protein